MKHVILTIILCCSGIVPAKAEGLYLTLGWGNNTNLFTDSNSWDDGNGVGAYFDLRYQWDKQKWCLNCMPSIGVTHLSQWDVGCPHDCDTYEDTVDHIGIGATWELYKK